jgi:hypothetical protein
MFRLYNSCYVPQCLQEGESWGLCHLPVSAVSQLGRHETHCNTHSTRKRRCIPTTKGEPCQLCHSLSIPCTLSLAPRPSVVNNHGGGTESTPSPRQPPVALAGPLEVLASRDLCVELVHIYFRFIHDIPHTIFHEPSFLRRLSDGTASTVHIYAMCALAAR